MTAVVKAELTLSFPHADRLPESEEEMEVLARNLEEFIAVPQFCEAEVQISKVWARD